MSDFMKDIRYRTARSTVLEKMIALNVVLFILPAVIAGILSLFNKDIEYFFQWVQLYPDVGELIFRPWTLLTYGFFHSGLMHILLNMLVLYFSGRIFLNLFDGKRFLNVYLLGILTGGLLFLLSYNVFPAFQGKFAPLVGASAGVYAILIFIATYIPDREIRIIFFNVKLWHIGVFVVVLNFIQLSSANAGGSLAHLGGALLGFFYARQLTKGKDIGEWFGKLMDGASNLFKPRQRTKTNLKTVYKKQANKKADKPLAKDLKQQQIDDILDKISKSGYDSLTKAEKDFLFRAGKEE